MFDVIRHIFTIPLQNQRNSKGYKLLFPHESPNPHIHTCYVNSVKYLIKVTDIYKLQCSLFVHDYKHNKLPISFNDYFSKTANPNSRKSANLFRHRPRTKFSSRLPKHKFPEIWNSLSHDHHSITSRNIFKKILKRSFLDS